MRSLDEIKKEYNKRVSLNEQELQKITGRIMLIVFLRFALFALVVATVVYAWERPAMFFLVTIFLFLFIRIVVRHKKLAHKRDFSKKCVKVYSEELSALEYDFSAFDDGAEFVDSAHPYTYDLDVFGNVSLFRSLNRCATVAGRTMLAGWLNNHLVEREAIIDRQRCVRELMSEHDFRCNLRVLGLLYDGGATDVSKIEAWANSPLHFIGKDYFFCLPFVALFVNVILIAFVVFGVIPGMFVGVSFFVFVFIASLFSGKITKIQSQYWKNLRALRAYAEQMALVESRRFSSPLLVKLQKRFFVADGNRRASELLADCTRMLDTLDQRNNIIAYVLLNGFMLWELLQIMNIERWRKSYAASLILWIETVGEFEAYSSLATFSFNNSSTNVFPQISDGDFHLNCEAVGHPLLHRDRCVANDVMLSANPSFMVVTGANMAGKSTYLRTIGVNFLLACVGASVCAKSMSVAPVPLFTSLRTADSLADNESYFFAELKRLSCIVDTLNRGGRLFVILDEILKGTNSFDKQRGSLALVKQFVSKGAYGIIATHDVLLGSLAEQLPGKVENFCFEADIIDNELVFGYKMRRGIVQNMNACFLMKKMGIDVSD